MDSTSLHTTHDLLLAVAGRVDDDLLAWTRELVAVGEDAHAVEMLTATLAADRVALPAAVRRQLVALAAAARIELDADAELAPAEPDSAGSAGSTGGTDGAARTTAIEHRFAADESLAGPVAIALAALPPRQLQGCRVLLTHRRTPAGSAPGPLPHPVVVVEVEPGTRRPDMLSYQLAAALERSGVPASVEVLTVGGAVPPYHAEALRSARRLRLDRGPAGRNHAETTVAVPALPSRRRPEPARPPAPPASLPAAPPAPGARRPQRHAGTTQPIGAATPFGTSSSDTPLFHSPALEGRAEEAGRGDAPDPAGSPSPGRLTAVPSVFDESSPDGRAGGQGPADHTDGDHASTGRPGEPAPDDPTGDDRADHDRADHDRADNDPTDHDQAGDDRVAEFRPEEFGRERRAPAHRIASADDHPEPRPTPRPKPRPGPGQVTPITRTPAGGPAPIPLLRRNGRRPLAPVDSEDGRDRDREGGTGPGDYDPLHDPLSRPLMAPLLDPTPPLTGPIGLVGDPDDRPSAVAAESWSGDWLSGAWAPRAADEQPPEPADAPAAEPEKPAPRPVRRSARHRYLRTPDPIEDEPAPERAGTTGGGSSARSGDAADLRSPSGAIPLPPATGPVPLPPAGGAGETSPADRTPDPSGSGAIPLPPATTGGSPQTPARPAIPMPSGDSRDTAGPPGLPDVDPAFGLRPESLARLGEADLDLLAKLQAELRGERRPHPDFGGTTPADGLPARSGANGHTNGTRRNGHGPTGPTGPAATGHDTAPRANGSATDTEQPEPDRNGSSRHGTGQRRGPFGRRRVERPDPDPDPDGNPPDIAG
jgi:hypothetical protein